MYFTGLKYCKINVHLLCLLPLYVRLFEPLWTHSAFSFEDCIGHLVKKCHGTHDIANQVNPPTANVVYICVYILIGHTCSVFYVDTHSSSIYILLWYL